MKTGKKSTISEWLPSMETAEVTETRSTMVTTSQWKMSVMEKSDNFDILLCTHPHI